MHYLYSLAVCNILVQLAQSGVFFKDHNPDRLPEHVNTFVVRDGILSSGDRDACLANCINDKDCIRNKDCNICDPKDKICTTGCGLSCTKDSDCSATKWCKVCKGINGCPERFCPRRCKREEKYNCAAKCYRNEDCHGGPCYLCGGGTCAIDK